MNKLRLEMRIGLLAYAIIIVLERFFQVTGAVICFGFGFALVLILMGVLPERIYERLKHLKKSIN